MNKGITKGEEKFNKEREEEYVCSVYYKVRGDKTAR